MAVYEQQVRRLESDVVCEGMMDTAIVLDGSNSIGAPKFQLVRQTHKIQK